MKLLKLPQHSQEKLKLRFWCKQKPGYTCLDLTFYLVFYEIDYAADAIIAVAEYYRNMQLTYFICSNRKILGQKMLHRAKKSHYSLDNDSKAADNILKEMQNTLIRLANRKITLNAQL